MAKATQTRKAQALPEPGPKVTRADQACAQRPWCAAGPHPCLADHEPCEGKVFPQARRGICRNSGRAVDHYRTHNILNIIVMQIMTPRQAPRCRCFYYIVVFGRSLNRPVGRSFICSSDNIVKRVEPC